MTADKIEAADVGGRELDAEIALSIRAPDWMEQKPWKRTNGWAKPNCAWDAWQVLFHDSGGNPLPLPPYTTSLDAAMTLVPEGWQFIITGGCGSSATADLALEGFEQDTATLGEASTPALALCAAALRAKAQADG